MTTIDLNSDLGEGYGAWPMGDDPAMLDVVSSANIACGAHAGDPVIMLATARAAAARGVAVGAHVAYRDLAGFGRRAVHVTPDELYADVVHQLGAMTAAAHVAGTAVTYVKPHGALYNTACADPVQAEAVVRAVADVDPTLAVLALPDSELLHAADRRGLRAVSESFADRAYEPDGSLVSRSTAGSVLHDPDQVAARVLRMVTEGVATAIDGSEIRVRAESVCVHGDSPSAVAMARAIRTLLTAQGVGIAPFAASPVVPFAPACRSRRSCRSCRDARPASGGRRRAAGHVRLARGGRRLPVRAAHGSAGRDRGGVRRPLAAVPVRRHHRRRTPRRGARRGPARRRRRRTRGRR